MTAPLCPCSCRPWRRCGSFLENAQDLGRNSGCAPVQLPPCTGRRPALYRHIGPSAMHPPPLVAPGASLGAHRNTLPTSRHGSGPHSLYSFRSVTNKCLHLAIMPCFGGGFICPTVAREDQGKWKFHLSGKVLPEY